MLFYGLLLLTILLLCFISYNFKCTEKIIGLIILTIIVTIGGFRDRVGSDYKLYSEWFLNGTRDNDFEFGFIAIMRTFRYLNLGYEFLFFFFSFFTYLFIYLALRKYTKEVSLSLLLYVLIPILFLCSFMYIRQCLAAAIAFYAFTFLLNKKYTAYFLLMILGISIHYSCVIPFVCFFWIYKRGYNTNLKILYVLLAFSFIISKVGIIYMLSLLIKDSHYFYYFSSKAIPVSLIKLFLINAIGVLFINYFDRNGFQYENQRYFLLFYICSIIFLNIFSESAELTRIYMYFRIFEIILIIDILRIALIEKRFVLIFLMCFIYLIPFFRAIKIDHESSLNDEFKLAPYRTLLFKV